MDNPAQNLRSLLEKPRPHWQPKEELSTPPRSEPASESQANEYEACGRARIGNRPQLTLVFTKCSGEVIGFPYANLMRITSQDVAQGFTLEFAGVEVVVQGRNLARVFRFVCDHRAAEIIEADRAEAMLANPDGPVVESIVVGTAKRL